MIRLLKALLSNGSHTDALQNLYKALECLIGPYKALKGFIKRLRALEGPEGAFKDVKDLIWHSRGLIEALKNLRRALEDLTMASNAINKVL